MYFNPNAGGQVEHTISVAKTNNLSILLEYSQLINELRNVEPKKYPTCIDLIFKSEPNLIAKIGTQPSLNSTHHQKLIDTKLCFKLHIPSPEIMEI